MKKALVFYGGWDGHTPNETAEVFREMLSESGFEVVMSNSLEILDNYDNISDFDLFVPVWTMGKMTDVQANNIAKAVKGGAGIAGCHGGMCDAFRENTTWQFVTGAQWVAHPGNSEVVYSVKLKEGNEFTVGLSDFEYKGEQYYLHVDPAVNVYATTDFEITDGEYSANGVVTMPVVFTKKWGDGKVFYFSIGHTYRDFEIPQVRTIMQRGFVWAAK